jgi:hypothetical protein
MLIFRPSNFGIQFWYQISNKRMKIVHDFVHDDLRARASKSLKMDPTSFGRKPVWQKPIRPKKVFDRTHLAE